MDWSSASVTVFPPRVLVVSISGLSPTTVTVSDCAASFSATSTRAVKPVVRMMSQRSTFANPDSSYSTE